MASGGACDMTLARCWLISRQPDGLKRGGECESGPAPKCQKFTCSNVCVLGVHSIKNAYILTNRALSSSLSKYGAACPASEQCTAAAHTSYSRASNVSTTPFQWRGAVSNIASKCPGSETRGMLSAQERSSRASPAKRAGDRFLQPLFRGTQKRLGNPPDSRSQAHQ